MTASFIMILLYLLFLFVAITTSTFVIIKYIRKNKQLHSEQQVAFTSHKEK